MHCFVAVDVTSLGLVIGFAIVNVSVMDDVVEVVVLAFANATAGVSVVLVLAALSLRCLYFCRCSQNITCDMGFSAGEKSGLKAAHPSPSCGTPLWFHWVCPLVPWVLLCSYGFAVWFP